MEKEEEGGFCEAATVAQVTVRHPHCEDCEEEAHTVRLAQSHTVGKAVHYLS